MQRGTAGINDTDIAEGFGKRSAAERCRYYDIARGAVYDASRILDVVDEQAVIQGKTLLVRIVSMLVRMTQ